MPRCASSKRTAMRRGEGLEGGVRMAETVFGFSPHGAFP